MKITVLIENTAAREGLLTEHGLSLYIETGGHRVLFDAGQSGAFAENAAKLGVDLETVDIAVLSHGHYDHGGGFSRFLAENHDAKFYVNQEAFLPHFNAWGKAIGLDPSLQETERIRFVPEPLTVAPGILLYPGKETAQPREASGLTVMEKGVLKPDDFRHEQYLMVEEHGKRILISGCSHRGIVNIMERFRPDVVVGGFHTKDIPTDREGAARLTELARRLREFPAVYYTCHCTGQEQYRILKAGMGLQLHKLSTGDIMTA